MMRLAPSSTNSQPWRSIVKGDIVHFYSKGAETVHMVDVGIGMSHFDMTERYRDYAPLVQRQIKSPRGSGITDLHSLLSASITEDIAISYHISE